MTDVVGSLSAAGFSEEEIGNYMTGQRQTLRTAGFNDDEIDAHFGIPRTPQQVPQPYVDRYTAGKNLATIFKDVAQGAVKGFGAEPVGPNEELFNLLQGWGVFAKDGVEPIFPQRLAWSAMAGIDAAMRMPGAVLGALAGYAKGTQQVIPGVSEEKAERAESDTMNMLNIGALLTAGAEELPTRLKQGADGTVRAQPIGGMPKGTDIQEASRAIGNGETTPLMENKVAALHQQKGLLPAEIAADAHTDPTIAQSILSSDPGDMPYGYQFHGYEALPETMAKAEAAAEEQRAVGLQAATREPYFQDPIKKGKPFKTDTPLLTSEPGDVPEYGMPVNEGFELKSPAEKADLREQLLLEGKEVAYSDAENQVLSKISIGEEAIRRPLTWNRLYTDFVDKLYPIGKAVSESNLADLTTENNPYQLARLMGGHVGKADHFLNNGTFDFNTYENNGLSLKQILEPISKDLNGFRAYAAASRAIELEGRGIESGFVEPGKPSAPPLMASGLDAARAVLIEGHGKYEKPFRALVDYQNRVSEYLRESGVLSEAGYRGMLEANKMYVPFSRVMGVDENAAARGGSSLQAHNPIKTIKGSARDIVDPIESIVRNTYHSIEMAERNQVGLKLVDVLRSAGKDLPAAIEKIENPKLERADAIAEAISEVGVKNPDALAEALAHGSEKEPPPGTISVMRDGKRETYKVDQELAIAMKGLDVDSAGTFARVFALPAETLRAGAVSTPEFWLRHVFRDFMYAVTTFKGGVFNPIDMGRGFAGLFVKDADYWNWLKGGGGNISSVGIDRRYLQEDLRKLTGETGLMGRAWNVLADPQASMWQKTTAVPKLPFQAIGKFVLDPLRAMTQFAENASHLGAFKKGMRASEQGEAPAGSLRDQIIRNAWVSRDTAVDAARMGANMRAYNMITAFANITVQDMDRVFRAIKDDPVNATLKIGGAVTVPSVLLWAANHNDPRYQEIPQWQKDMFWLVMTPNHVFRIPKPWGMGLVFGTVPERLLDAFVAEKPQAFKDLGEQFVKQNIPGFVPTAFQPVIEQFANRSTFTNRTLIPSAQEKWLPEYQQTPYTTELTKALGRMIGSFPGMEARIPGNESFLSGPARALSSPILLENYIRGWTGGLGEYALMAADTALRKQGILPDPPMPTRTLADIPVIRAFAVRYPSASAQSIQDFYDGYSQQQSYFQTFMAKAKEGDVAAMEHIEDMGGPAMFLRLDTINRTLNEHNKLIGDIVKNPQIQSDEKRQLIDQLYYSMIQVARSGNDAMRQMQQQVSRRNFLPAPLRQPAQEQFAPASYGGIRG